MQQTRQSNRMKLSPSVVRACMLCLAAATGAAEARLGENREQCAVRYGQPVAEVPALLGTATGTSYQKGDFRIRIEFLEDKAAFISFARRGLRSEERQTLLDVNAGPLAWNPSGEFLGRLCWTAPGNSQQPARHASAYTVADTNYLDLATDEWARSMRAQQAVQFAIQPRAATPAPAAAPGSTPAPAAGTRLEGF